MSDRLKGLLASLPPLAEIDDKFVDNLCKEAFQELAWNAFSEGAKSYEAIALLRLLCSELRGRGSVEATQRFKMSHFAMSSLLELEQEFASIDAVAVDTASDQSRSNVVPAPPTSAQTSTE
jgi:hypothetical protein